MYSRLVDKCFNDCIDDFTSKSVSAREEGCVMRCWDKNMKSQERIQQRYVENHTLLLVLLAHTFVRFQEHNEAMMASGSISQR